MRLKLILLVCLVCLCVSARADKKTRGVASIEKDAPAYLEKGQWMVGGSISWSKHTNDNYKFVVVDNINSRGYQLSVRPTFLCAVSKNLAVGGTFFYKRGFMDMASANVSISDISLKVTDYYILSHKYGGRAFVRPYLPIGQSGRVAFFVDAGIEIEGGQSKVTDRQGTNTIGTYQTSWGISLGAQPGISAFITRHFAMEASLGYVGIGFTSVKQEHNQITEGGRNSIGGNFGLNFLSLSIGMYYSF